MKDIMDDIGLLRETEDGNYILEKFYSELLSYENNRHTSAMWCIDNDYTIINEELLLNEDISKEDRDLMVFFDEETGEYYELEGADFECYNISFIHRIHLEKRK